ncbi:hypothetical protein U9M48_011432 [Paspalum notatum var. saurae]|uniref:Uncharacterized protein n=1 Tax=Paspalum notatum var. saurae TaxID=547442 RepID=A0AAQ3SVN5_PASNO
MAGRRKNWERDDVHLTAACALREHEFQNCGGSCECTTEIECSTKKDGDETGFGDSEDSCLWKFNSRPLLQEQCSLQEPELLRNKSFLNQLFQCCGLLDLFIGKNSKVLHVSEKEIVLHNDNTSEETRLFYAIEKVSLACMGLEWLYDDFCKHHKAFNELLQKIKSWKTETRATRGMLLLTYFGDYSKTEAIFSFLRIASTAWILTHPELSAFHPIEDGCSLEEYCRSQIIQRRSYADHLAITALADALGIQIKIFHLESGNIYVIPSVQSAAVPTVSLALH